MWKFSNFSIIASQDILSNTLNSLNPFNIVEHAKGQAIHNAITSSNADVIIKATKVDGSYSEDPLLNPDAIKYPKITFKEVIDKELKIMDMTAVTLCKENNLPIIVFDINNDENLVNLIDSKHVGTLVS